VNVTWRTAASSDAVGVLLELNLDQHGGSGGFIECEAEDTGSFTIPAALVSALFERGLSGFPSLLLTRRSANSATIDLGCVQFAVTARAGLMVEVPGLRSCSSDADCADGQTCGTDLTCG
jgi:hypothetical protein